MKIAMLTVDYLPNIGGITGHIYHVSHALRKLGQEVVVVNPVPRDRPGIERFEEGGVPGYRCGFVSHGNRLRRVWCRAQAGLQGLSCAAADFGGLDILHQHDHYTSTPAARLFGGHAAWVWTNHTSRFQRNFEKPLLRGALPWIYRGVKGIISVSPDRFEKTKVVWGDRVPLAYIPNGVDTTRFHPEVRANRAQFDLAADDFVVLCPNRMTPMKGALYLAQAVNKILQRSSQARWRFVFLGSDLAVNTDADYVASVRKELEPAFQRGCVRYLGNIPMAQMPEINALADVIVLPSLWDAVSLSALESLASRRAVVATNVGGLPEVVRPDETGLLVPPKDPEALAKAILRFHDDAALREHCAATAARLTVENYSWNKIAERTLMFYKKITGKDRN